MMNIETLSARIKEAIRTDEIGIESAHYGKYRLKTLYQPVYCNRADGLIPCGVEGLAGPLKGSEPVPTQSFFSDVTAKRDNLFVETLCHTLHLYNYPNLWTDGLELFVKFCANSDIGSAGIRQQIADLAAFLDEMDIAPSLMACEIMSTADDAFLAIAVSELRRHDIRITVGNFGWGSDSITSIEVLKPDVVKIDGRWFRQTANAPKAASLLRPLVTTLHAKGHDVLIQGIETAEQLRIAMLSGAKYLQGHLLGRPKPAGAVFETDPLRVDGLLNQDDRIIPLFTAPEPGRLI